VPPRAWLSCSGRAAAELRVSARDGDGHPAGGVGVTATPQRDPRSIVTPEAFEVSDALLGMPLATPGRRAAALAVDGVVIAIIAGLTKSFGLILGVVAAALFVRAGFKRTKVRGSAFDRAMRASVGCLGLVIAVVTAGLWVAFGFSLSRDDGPPLPERVATGFESRGVTRTIAAALAATGVVEVYEGVESLAEAEDRARDILEAADEMDLDDATLRSLLLDGIPEDAIWAEEGREMVQGLLAADAARPAEIEPTSDTRAEVASLTDEEALLAYAELLSEDTESEGVAARRAELESRLGALVAADTVEALTSRVGSLEREVERRRGDLRDAENELDEARNVGLFARLRGLADALGFGFGWAAVYMTIIMSWWNGQTVGKRMMGIRVVRLDGEPITWWVAFERVGGYAAGFATGLLGFAQIWWDANRQAIHDRIVGTVVVVEGATKVSDWESAL